MDYEQAEVTAVIIQSIIKVHRVLGPGFLESVYHNALKRELERSGLALETERKIVIYYQGEEVGVHYLDLLVENSVIVELKTVDELSKAHYAQVRSYLTAANLNIAILVNFSKEKADFRRIERHKEPHPRIPDHPPIPLSGNEKRP